MTAREIYRALCTFYQTDGKEGISSEGLKKECTVREIPDPDMDVISHTEFIAEDGKVVEIYTSYDHSRAFDPQPDTNHFYISYYDNNGNELETFHHMTVDSM